MNIHLDCFNYLMINGVKINEVKINEVKYLYHSE
mgnify:CR=1 FL=1